MITTAEIPDLQRSRLFSLERARCAKGLHTLVSEGLLRTDGRTFLHARRGRHHV